MKLLVTGGAGYIGSITVKYLLSQGHEVVVFDNLSFGHKDAVNCELVVGDLTDKKLLFESLSNHDFDGVIHFAASALAGESMKNPYKYFQNNILGGLNLLELMREKDVKKIIFSSTCAIYGTPINLPVTEKESKKPESVYGESKLMFEEILKWYDIVYGIKHFNLRYFNAAGAAIDASIGEMHDPETHIIPIAIKCAIDNSPFSLFGNDYETKDGTCVRDYIHVEDLAIAHLQAMSYLSKNMKSESVNLGTGVGYSNLEIINAIKKVSGKDFPVEFKPRREGDPAMIFADNSKAKDLIEFSPKYTELDTIVSTAWQWHIKNG